MNTTATATVANPKPAVTAAADQLAATLRDRRTQHDGEVCDAFDPCAVCVADRVRVAGMRIPEQRKGSE